VVARRGGERTVLLRGVVVLGRQGAAVARPAAAGMVGRRSAASARRCVRSGPRGPALGHASPIWAADDGHLREAAAGRPLVPALLRPDLVGGDGVWLLPCGVAVGVLLAPWWLAGMLWFVVGKEWWLEGDEWHRRGRGCCILLSSTGKRKKDC
jgi:hypothetical protein